jgi:hypothetical protein
MLYNFECICSAFVSEGWPSPSAEVGGWSWWVFDADKETQVFCKAGKLQCVADYSCNNVKFIYHTKTCHLWHKEKCCQVHQDRWTN